METENYQQTQIIEKPGNSIAVTESSGKTPPTVEEIESWLVSYLAEILEINASKVDVTLPFERYGLDSSAMIVLSGDLQSWLGRNLDPTLLYDYPTIEILVKYLSDSDSKS